MVKVYVGTEEECVHVYTFNDDVALACIALCQFLWPRVVVTSMDVDQSLIVKEDEPFKAFEPSVN